MATLRASCSVVLLGLLSAGRAEALPDPLLGPDGVFWVGNLSPGSPAPLRAQRESVLVEPHSGDLIVEAKDFRFVEGAPIDVLRSYTNGSWRFSFQHQLIEKEDHILLMHEAGDVRFEKDLPSDPSLETRSSFEQGAFTLERSPEGWLLQHGRRTERYDTNGFLVERKEGSRVQVQFKREEGRLSQIVGPEGRSLSVLYDGSGLISVMRSDDGRELYYENRNGKLTSVSGAPGGRVRYLYNSAEMLNGILWSDGSRMRIDRDNQQRVSQLYGPGNHSQDYTWLSSGLSIRDADGATKRIIFSDDGYTVSRPDGQTVTVQMEDGSLSGWTDPSGTETRIRKREGQINQVQVGGIGNWTLGWQASGLARIEDPIGAAWTYSRNSEGELISLQEPDGVKRSFSRDSQGRIRSIDSASGSLRLQRDGKGRIQSIQRASGAETRLNRNSQGRITAFIDPAGGEIGLSRDSTGQISGIRERTEEEWKIQNDSLGRPKSLKTPSGGQLKWHRSSQGRIDQLLSGEDRQVNFGVNALGLPSLMRSADGRSRKLLWSSTRSLSQIQLEDGSTLKLSRDSHSRLSQVRFNDQAFPFRRDPQGLPETVGPLNFKWLSNGAWTAIKGPGFQLDLQRGFGGSVRSLSYGDTQLPLVRDSSGNIIQMGRGDDRMELGRDANGLIVKLARPGLEVRFKRDVRSLVTQSTLPRLDHRSLYDRAGRMLKVSDAEGTALSAQYDNEGRPSMLRFPSGNIARHGYGPGARYLQIEDSDGKSLLARQVLVDPNGLITESKEGEQAQIYHRDTRGQIVSIEAAPVAWSWLPDALEGPDDYLLEFNEQARPTTARLPIGTQLWGGLVTRANYSLEEGRISRLSLDSVEINFSLDALGRPVGVDASDGRWWRLKWDPLGRLIRIESEEIEENLLHGLDGPLGEANQLFEANYLSMPKRGWVRTGDGTAEWMLDERGLARLVQTYNRKQLVSWTPTGLPSAGVGSLRRHGSWSSLDDGLTLDAGGAIESLSGQRLQSSWSPPWKQKQELARGWGAAEGSHVSWWAPDPWMQSGPFAEPLKLLVALGELDPGIDADWTSMGPRPAPLPWLPPSASTHSPPLGPARNALPIAMSPLEALCLRASIGPVFPLSSKEIGLALLAPEFQDLPELHWLSSKGWTWWLMGADTWLDLP